MQIPIIRITIFQQNGIWNVRKVLENNKIALSGLPHLEYDADDAIIKDALVRILANNGQIIDVNEIIDNSQQNFRSFLWKK